MNKDKLNSVCPEDVASAVLKQVDSSSDFSKEIQAISFAVTLIVFCRKCNIDVGDVFTIANNILFSKHKENKGLKALESYMQNEF